jgi:hypothetical protein
MRHILAICCAIAATAALTACNSDQPPPHPTVGQTWTQPGNEDTCRWTGTRWVEVDDGEDCEPDDSSHHHRTRRGTTRRHR